jgi:hypothetical protein
MLLVMADLIAYPVIFSYVKIPLRQCSVTHFFSPYREPYLIGIPDRLRLTLSSPDRKHLLSSIE